MIDVTTLPFYGAKSTIINQFTIEQENNLFSPRTERAYKDRTTQVVVKRNAILYALKSARQTIWTAIDFNDADKDGNVNLKVVDPSTFQAQRSITSGALVQLAKVDKAISALDAMGATSYDDIKRVVDTNTQKVQHLQSKLLTLERSTRSSDADLKKQVKELKEEISNTESVLKYHTDILTKLNKILVEVDL